MVLVQIRLDRNLLSTHSCLKIVTGRCLLFFVWGEFLSVSWISLEHHGSFMVADWCWDYRHSEFGYGGVKTQCECTLTSWPSPKPHLFMRLIIKTSFSESIKTSFESIAALNSTILLFPDIVSQTPSFPHRPPSLAVISALSWAESGDPVNITMPFLSRDVIWFFYLGENSIAR